MSKPVIGVIACTREVEGEAAQTVKNRYLEALAAHADAIPVVVPAIEQAGDVADVVARLDALMLTGSNSNIEPSAYGADPRTGSAPFDPARDALSAALIRSAIEAQKPVLGICRGFQEINVAFGGTLVDERTVEDQSYSHHAPEGAELAAMFAHSHQVDVIKGSLLETIAGGGRLVVNSVHFQRVERLGKGLVAEAVSEDNVIEALRATTAAAPVLALQWHPEWRPETRAHDLAIWSWFGRVARGQTI